MVRSTALQERRTSRTPAPREGASRQLAAQVAVTGVPEPPPWRPKLVVTPAPRLPLYAAFVTWTVPLVPVFTPFQTLVIVAPLGRVRVTRQPLMAALPACTSTFATKPPGHELVTL